MDFTFIKQWISAGNIDIPALLLQNYRELGISDQEFIFILHVKYNLDRGEVFPDLKQIGQFMNEDLESIYQIVQHLIENNNLSIETIEIGEGRTTDKMSLDLLWEKLYMLSVQKETQNTENQSINLQKDLYSMFEAEFGRPLSPIETQTLSMWLYEDQYSAELIALALKEAVLAQAYSFKYIDRVLLNWSKKNITTKEQVKKESEKFRQSKREEESSDNNHYDPVPMFNWLKPREDGEDD